MTLPAWGKFDSTTGSFHHLAHHSMDVAAVFQRLLGLSAFRDRAECAMKRPLSSADIARLGVLVFLHDVGKLHPAFQAKAWPKESWRHPTRGHASESISIVQHACGHADHPFAQLVRVLSTWGPGVEPLILASFSHHGRPLAPGIELSLKDWDWPKPPNYRWRSEAVCMVEVLRRWFPAAFEDGDPLPDAEQFVHFFAGLAALADWVGSYREFFRFSGELDLGYDSVAHDRAAQVLTATGLDIGRFPGLSTPTFFDVSAFRDARPAQVVVGATSLDERLIILEAETGAGKTEAALWRFAQLFAERRVEGLYFAVPTRAAARQLHGRVHGAVKRLFGEQGPEAVLAIPGIVRAGEAAGRRLPDWNVLWDDTKGPVPARWAAEHATRFLSATVAVGTVDQAMLAGLAVKHAHLRGSALSRSLLVVDEVHASDAYMTRVLSGLLNAHLVIGGYAMLMSATLGSRARVRWTGESQPTLNEAVNAPYPAVWSGGHPVPTAVHGGVRTKSVEISLDGVQASRAAKLAMEAADKGARVLVIRNTVKGAVETWTEVRQRGGASKLLRAGNGPALHHSRFAVEDRELLDRAVEAVLSTQKNRPRQGVIVIGTQTLEQSLDIDADFLITDLCPADVLLQRIGRLHRHELPRPEAFGSARCIVMVPEEGLDRLTKPAFDNGLGAWLDGGVLQGIYRDLAVLELTRQLVEDKPIWTIPDMNRELVEGATHPERIARLIEEKGEKWQKYDRQHGGAEAAEAAFAQLQRLDRDTPYGDQFPSTDERIMTRLGEEGVILDLSPPPTGPFGTAVTRLALPARWSQGVSVDDIEGMATSANPDGFEFEVGSKSFVYGRTGFDVKRKPR